MKITSGSDRIWSSQDCPDSIKPADVVVRNGVPTYVNVVWSGRRSDDTCSRTAAWANAGYYHVFAAVLGSTPTDIQFEVTRAPTDFVTKTAKPKPSQSPSRRPPRPAEGHVHAERDRLRQGVEVRRRQRGGQLLRLLLGSPGFETRRSAPRSSGLSRRSSTSTLFTSSQART